MQTKRILQNGLPPLLAVIIVFGTSTFTYLTLRLYLQAHTQEVASRFYTEGQTGINHLDAFDTSVELNAISGQDNWTCLIAKGSEGYIFNKRQSQCATNWRQQSIVLKSHGENGIYVRLTLRLPIWMELSSVAFVVAQIILLIAFVVFHQQALSVKYKHEAELGQLARQVSHDLRSPIGALNVLLGEAKNSLLPEHRHLLSLALERISTIVNELLQTTRGKQANFVTNVNECVREIVLLKKIEYQEHSELRIVHYLSADAALSSLPASDLKTILSNLITNACEAQNFIGEVHVRLQPCGNRWEVSVNDNGPGFTPYIIDKVGVSRVTSQKVNGNGIGLYSAHQMLKSHGLKLSVQNLESRGACVKIIV